MTRPADLEHVQRMDRRLLTMLDETQQTAGELAGEWLACGPGCSDCCHGPFPITRLDARRLRQGLSRLEPARARRIERRARETLRILEENYPGDLGTGRLEADQAELDAYFAGHAELACPVLDPQSGRCELYEFRPVACRTYGPPLRYGDEVTDPCPLCFRGADPATVERCRVAPDAADLEGEILAELGVVAGEEWETLIAPALIRE